MAGFRGSAGQLTRRIRCKKFLERMKREPMKTLAEQLQKLLDKLARAFPSSRFPVPVPVRVVNRPQNR
jgi:hypothetical protein